MTRGVRPMRGRGERRENVFLDGGAAFQQGGGLPLPVVHELLIVVCFICPFYFICAWHHSVRPAFDFFSEGIDEIISIFDRLEESAFEGLQIFDAGACQCFFL